MQSITSKPLGLGQSMAILAFVLAGFLYSPLFFAGVFLIAGLAIAKRHKLPGYAIAAFGVIYFLVTLGFGIGEDMAKRDNARTSSARSQ